MKNNIKQSFDSKYDQDINYNKIINKIDNRKQKDYTRYIKPVTYVCVGLVFMFVVTSIFNGSMLSNNSKDAIATNEMVMFDSNSYDGAGMYYDAADSYSGSTIELKNEEAKIIYTANINFETKNFNESYNALNNLVKKYNGYILSSNAWNNEYEGVTYNYGNYTVRIPVDNYEAFMSDTNGVGIVQNVSSNQDDITDEYIDVATRIETLKAQEKRLVELLDEAKDLSDIITIEDKLTSVRYNIESYQSTMNYYTKVTDYATITISISEVINYSNNNKILKAINNTIDNFIGVLEDVAVFIIYALPFVLVIGVIVLIVILVKKKRNK